MAKWPNDHELEEIYRKGSEAHDFPYDPKAWDQMNTLLNKEKRRRLLLILFFAIGLIASVSLIFISNKNKTNVNPDSIVHVTDSRANSSSSASASSSLDADGKTEQSGDSDRNANENLDSNSSSSVGSNLSSKSSSKSSLDADGRTEQSRDPDLITNENREANAGISSSSSPGSRSKSSLDTEGRAEQSGDPDRIVNEHSDSKVSANSFSVETEHIKSKFENGHPKTAIDKNHKEIISNAKLGKSVVIHAKPEEANNELSNKPGIPEFKIYSEISAITFLKPIKIIPIELDNQKPLLPFEFIIEEEEEVQKNSKLAFDISMGAESSKTPNGSSSKLDLSLGVGATYFLNSKLGLSFGGNYISDVYTAMEGDYHPPRGYWSGKGAPEFTAATCKMIETYYGISYYWNSRSKKGLSTNLSVLSNFMIDEKYYYHYPRNEDSFSSNWTMSNTTWLSALSISTDYRFKIGDKWFIQSGPYAKIPIDGIGHGKVMLSSFGWRLRISLMSK